MAYRDMYIEGNNVTRIVKALSSDIRIQILNLLENEELNLQTIAKRLELSKTNALTHINILEEAGFIKTRYVPGTVGNQKMCRKQYDRLIFNFSPQKEENRRDYYEISVPVGNYFDFEVYPPCGLASKDNVIKKWDDPLVFFDIERVNASIVWGSYGFVEYKIPLKEPFELNRVTRIEITLEVSAQGELTEHRALSLPSYLDRSQLTDGISDLTFWINGTEVGTVTVEEYNRGSGGRFTPTWWKGSNYGKQVRLALGNDKIAINDTIQAAGKLPDLNLKDCLTLKVGIKRDAKNKSGFNIYGSHFGNYGNDIVVKIFDNRS